MGACKVISSTHNIIISFLGNFSSFNFSLFTSSQTYTFSGGDQQQGQEGEATGGLGDTVETGPVGGLYPPGHSGSYVSLVVVMALGFVLIIMTVSGLAMVFCGRRKAR